MNTLDIISLIVSFSALVVAIRIPVKIMEYQRFLNMYTSYMSYDYAEAFQGVINFYYDDCGCDVERIPDEYYRRYKEDFSPGEKDASKILHYQRRYLNDYFYEIEKCRELNSKLRKEIKDFFTRNDAFVAKILIYMNKAVDENPQIYKDITPIKRSRMPKTKGLNCYLERLYEDLKSEGRWI